MQLKAGRAGRGKVQAEVRMGHAVVAVAAVAAVVDVWEWERKGRCEAEGV